MRRKILLIACLSALGQAYGQTAAKENDETSELSSELAPELSPVLVTARGVSERPLDVPFTINVIDGETVEKQHFISTEDSLRYVPGIELHSSGDVSYSNLKIRGSGSLSPTSLDDNSVGIHVDGVAQGLVGLSRNLYDVAQIEVAKGPQGTLFGRNSSSGAINIKTNDPESFFDSRVTVGIGNDNNRYFQGMINAPLSDTFYLRVAGTSRVKDNAIYDKSTNKPLNKQKQNGIRGKVLWEPNAQTQWLLESYYDERSGYLPLTVKPPYDKHHPRYDTGGLKHSGERSTKGISSDFTYDWDNLRFQSVTALMRHKGEFTRAGQPIDFLPSFYALYQVPPAFHPTLNAYFGNPANNQFTQADDIRQLSQEFRLSSQPDAPVQWVGGLYFSRNKRTFHYHSYRGVLPALKLGVDALNADIIRTSTINTQAIFGEATVPVSQHLKAIAGVRLTHEKLDYQSQWLPNPVNPLSKLGNRKYEQEISDTYITGRVGLDYALNSAWHAYGLYSRGHKSAGFADFGNTNIVGGGTETPYQSGRVDAFELGLKGESADGQWGAAIAVFQNQTKNDKISVPSKTNPYISDMENVDSRARGVEFDGYWRVADNWTLKSAFSYIDSKVTNVPATAQRVTKVGNRMPQVPKFDAKLGVEYRQSIASSWLKNANVFADANIRYVGSRAAEADNRLTLDAYHLLDASIGIGGDNGKVTLWGKNLTNESWVTYAGLLGRDMFGLSGAGRTFGVDFTYNF